MRASSAARWFLCALVISACEIQDESGGEGGSGGAVGGGMGEGGGGSGGEGGAGGGVPEGPCDMLGRAQCGQRDDCAFQDGRCTDAEGAPCAALQNEAQCDGRDECASRRDVFGDFAGCRELGGVPCADLDEGRCGRRDDCGWDGDSCEAPQPGCADHADAASCARGGCHWWADTCNTDPAPERCDFDDEDACLAANCAWTPQGCRPDDGELPPCERLAEGACHARDECRWTGRACELDPGRLACAALEMNACAERADCAWNGERCADLGGARCGALDEPTCLGRPDCQPVYGAQDNCGCAGAGGANGGGANGGGAGEAPDPDADRAPVPPCEDPDNCGGVDVPCDCGQAFLGCEARRVDCHNVPADACEATPGCRLEVGNCNGADPIPCDCAPGADDCACLVAPPCEEAVCVPEDEAGCEGRAPEQCAADGRCHLEQIEVCDGGGMGEVPVPPDGRRPIPACRVENLCVPNAGGGCGDLFDAQSCLARPDCAWNQKPDCACDGGGAPFPCDCAPDDANCVCAQPEPAPCDDCFACEPRVDPCEALPVDLCARVEGCRIEEVEVCGCAGMAGAGGAAGDADFAAPPPDADPPEGVPAEPCLCEIQQRCVSDGNGPQPCEALDEFACSQRMDCRFIFDDQGGGAPGEAPPPPLPEDCGCDPNDPACGCAADPIIIAPNPGQCVPAWLPPQCGELGPDQCADNPECAVIELLPPCPPCLPEAPPEECPRCEPIQQCVNVAEYCGRYGPDECANDPLCVPQAVQFCAQEEPACPPGVDCLIALPPDCGEEIVCVPAAHACDAIADPDRCEATPGCIRLRGPDDGDLGCWFAGPDGCWGLDAGRCTADPECELGQGGGVCGCEIDAAGNEICWCEGMGGEPGGAGRPAPGGELVCMPRQPDGPAACMADADCGPGGACFDGLCVMGQCNDAAACPPNAVCVNGMCVEV